MLMNLLGAVSFWDLGPLPPWVYLALGAVMTIAGLYIIIDPKAFLRWGRGRNYGGKEPSKSSLMAARIVGAAIIAMVVVTYLSLTQQ